MASMTVDDLSMKESCCLPREMMNVTVGFVRNAWTNCCSRSIDLPLAETIRSPSRRPDWARIPLAEMSETTRTVAPSETRSWLNHTPRSGGRTIWAATGGAMDRLDKLATKRSTSELQTRWAIGPPVAPE